MGASPRRRLQAATREPTVAYSRQQSVDRPERLADVRLRPHLTVAGCRQPAGHRSLEPRRQFDDGGGFYSAHWGAAQYDVTCVASYNASPTIHMGTSQGNRRPRGVLGAGTPQQVLHRGVQMWAYGRRDAGFGRIPPKALQNRAQWYQIGVARSRPVGVELGCNVVGRGVVGSV